MGGGGLECWGNPWTHVQQMVVRMLEVDGPPEIFWLMLQFSRTPLCPLFDHISVRKHTGPGDCQGQEVALMMKKTLYGAEINRFASSPCFFRPD